MESQTGRHRTVKPSRPGKQEAQRMCCGNVGVGLAVGFVQEMRKAWEQRCRDRKTPAWLRNTEQCRPEEQGEVGSRKPTCKEAWGHSVRTVVGVEKTLQLMNLGKCWLRTTLGVRYLIRGRITKLPWWLWVRFALDTYFQEKKKKVSRRITDVPKQRFGAGFICWFCFEIETAQVKYHFPSCEYHCG